MARVNLRSARRTMAMTSFWYRSKTLELDFPLTKRARYSTLSSRPRNTAPAWAFASAGRSLRPTAADYGLRTTIRAERVFISRWLSPPTPRAWEPTRVEIHPPSTWRIVQSEIAAKDLHLLAVEAALRRRRFHECDRRWLQRS